MNKILTAPVKKIITALSAAGETRVVGGAVRDAVMGRALGDCDMATTVLPADMMEILQKNGIKCVPTGLAHGTITAVIDHVGYEVTTLRRDVATDGRHATVVFTDDWQQDAARRDFTFNALYMDASGKIYDYFNGADDAAAGCVRFIGDAEARIREDVLRILRFFRFYAWFGRGSADDNGLAACRACADLIPSLSAERVAKEVLKLLAAPNPAPTWQIMMAAGINNYVVPEATNNVRLEQLGAQGDGLLRLAALLPESEPVATQVAARLKLSKRDSERLALLATLPAMLRTAPALRPMLYRYGGEACQQALQLNGGINSDNAKIIADWENPIFPIKGEDILRAGIPTGTRVGEILRAIEEWWIAGDFRATRLDCLAYAANKSEINHDL